MMIQSQKGQQNLKKDKQNKSFSNSSFSSNNDQLGSQNLKNKSTSLQKICQYLNFFTNFQNVQEGFINPKSHADYKNTQLIDCQQDSNEKNNNQLPSYNLPNNETQLNQKTLRFLSSYQNFHHQKLEKKILKSSRFKKQDSFTSELLIQDIHPSKHYEIVKIKVQILSYSTEISIINKLIKSPLPSVSQISGSGGFGTVYFIRAGFDELAIKSMQIPSIKKLNSESLKQISLLLMRAVSEYFWLMFFQQLEIGPETRTICGFDIILYEDSIQFATEICEQIRTRGQQQLNKYHSQVSKAVFDMHMLQVTHKDIKPTNIMFSPRFNKHVLIDFGCTVGFNQTLGQMSIIKFFAGTSTYSSKEMLNLLSKKQNFVDLYFNDLFGLKKTFQDFNKSNLKPKATISEPNISHYEQLYLENLLYENDFETFIDLWYKVVKRYYDEIEEISINVVRFLSELKITSQIRHFYWTQIDEKIRQLSEFRQLSILMTNQNELFSEISVLKEKEQNFKLFESIYKIVVIQVSIFNLQERQFEYLLINKDKLMQYLQSTSKKLKQITNGTKQNQRQRLNVFLIIALFSSLGSNQYTQKVDDKIHACQIGIQLFGKLYKDKKDKQTLFQTSIKSFFPIAKFHQLFLFYIWAKVPTKFKSISIINSIITLYLLGCPTDHTLRTSTTYILHSAFISAKKQLLQSQQKLRVLAIKIFWQYKLASIVFSCVFYNINKLTLAKLSISQNLKKQYEQVVKLLFYNQSDSQLSIIFEINRFFYQELVINYQNLNQLTYGKLMLLLNQPVVLKLQRSYSDIRKWKKIMILLTCSFGKISQVQSAGKNVSKLCQQIFFQNQHKDDILLYMVSLFLQNVLQQRSNYYIYLIMDKIVNNLEISLRIAPNERLTSSLQRTDFKIIDLIIDLIQKQSITDLFNFIDHNILYSIVSSIYNFVEDYINNVPMFDNQSVYLLGKCFHILKQLILVGYLNLKFDNCFLKQKMVYMSQISSQMIENILNRRTIVKGFFQHILGLTQIFQKISPLIKKGINKSLIDCTSSDSHQQISQENLWRDIEPQHLAFLNNIFLNKELLNFSAYWFESFAKFPQIKQLIKSSRTLTNLFFKIYLSDCQTLTEIYKGQSIIQDFFDFTSPETFQNINDTYKIIPSFEIAFEYFKIKILKTNYEVEECEKLIKLFRICAQKESFHMIIQKKGINRFLFNSFLYTNKSHQQIFELLIFFMQALEKSPKIEQVKIFSKHLKSFLWCKCQNCFPRPPPQNWNPDQFVQYLFKSISQVKSSQNSYMSIVYYYTMYNRVLKKQVSQKFIKFILRSMPYLSKNVKNILMGKLHILIYAAFYSQQKKAYFYQNGLQSFGRMKNVPLSERNLSIHRKFQYYFLKSIKNQTTKLDTIDIVIEKILIKDCYYKNYKLPKMIKQNYNKKLKRFFQVKQNYKHFDQIKQLLVTKHTSFNLSTI